MLRWKVFHWTEGVPCYHLWGGHVPLQLNKMDEVEACLWPEMKKQMRAFLGMASYYRQFIFAFEELTSPLWVLTENSERFLRSSYLYLTMSSLLFHRLTFRTGGSGLSCPRRLRGSTIRCCPLAGSSRSGRSSTARWKKNVSASSGWSVP